MQIVSNKCLKNHIKNEYPTFLLYYINDNVKQILYKVFTVNKVCGIIV